jgi:D-alanyl-D-alanine carboxypeptidase
LSRSRSIHDRSITIARRPASSASVPSPAERSGGANSLRSLPGGRRRRRANEDIPIAQRTTPALSTRPGLLSRVGLAGLATVLVGGSLLLIFPAPIRRWLTPPPVEGLNARLSSDGRLLGHFPYPEASGNDLVEVSPGHALHRDAASALLAMQRAAAVDGVSLTVLSAFRPTSVQKELFFDVKSERNQSALQRARVSAPPGFSEHSTGYAVDLGDGRAPQANLSESFAGTSAFRWLQDHAARFHFILSFPADNPQGVNYEPWHWRFEGSAAALQLFEPAQRLPR